MVEPTTSMPSGIDTSNLTGQVPSEVMQAIFNAIYQGVLQGYGILGQTGRVPKLKWQTQKVPLPGGGTMDIGSFVPMDGETEQTLAGIQSWVTANRDQVNGFAQLAQRTGRAPRVQINDDGTLGLQTDESGNVIFDEDITSRQQRLLAGQAIGYVNPDLLKPPPNTSPPTTIARGTITPMSVIPRPPLPFSSTNTVSNRSPVMGTGQASGQNNPPQATPQQQAQPQQQARQEAVDLGNGMAQNYQIDSSGNRTPVGDPYDIQEPGGNIPAAGAPPPEQPAPEQPQEDEWESFAVDLGNGMAQNKRRNKRTGEVQDDGDPYQIEG